MEIRESSFDFARTEGSGPQGAEATISFPRAVRVDAGGVPLVAAGIIGYSATFEDQSDHHFGRLIVEVSARVQGDTPSNVIVSGSLGLRDWSGEWDDHYSGNIQYVVLAELEAVAPPAPGDARGDLIITGAEITQAIQHFRSSQHLDSANVFPDNSIRMVADKPTAVRLYVDYDASSGLQAIARLDGTLEVVRGGSTDTLDPLRTIVPRRDTEIDRGQRNHTMNFVIPEEHCRGTVTLRARVFDDANPDQFSQTFERQIQFDDLPALPVIAIGIKYTGPDRTDGATDETLAAPVESDFVDTLEFTESVFPTPAVTITSYDTIEYDEEVESDINEGCDKLDDLLDAVREMRGDSEDIVYGLYNTGVNTGSVGGCGSGGAGVGRIGSGVTAAHELGHALGRQHAPCDNVTRCATPHNTDDNYPEYSGFDSDSIGEYGFDTTSTTGRVLDPATAHDIMGYSGNRWISPYTYKALMSRLPEVGGGAAAAAFIESRAPGRRDHGEWIKRKHPHLFLHLTIGRDRSVHFLPAFHFPVFPQAHGHTPTDFVVELLDDSGQVLKSACLYAGRHEAGCGCDGRWPVRIHQAVSFDPKAAKLVIYECDKMIYEQAIPAPPTVEVGCKGADDPGATHLTLQWNASTPEGTSDKDLWHLVQWRDARGTWRGAALRTQETSLRVPRRLFGKQQKIALRVLATSGIATGEGLWEGELIHARPQRSPDGDLRVHLAGVPSKGSGSWPLPAVVRVGILNATGQTVPKARVRWYNARGAEIGRGHTFDLRRLRAGFHVLRAAVLDTGYGTGVAEWMIEQTKEDEFVLHRGDRKRQAVKRQGGKE